MTPCATVYGFDAVAASCWTKLLLYRIEKGPEEHWDKVERDLAIVLRASKLCPSSHSDFRAILKAMQDAVWDDSSQPLRVGALWITVYCVLMF